MSRVVIAVDSFKECLSSVEIAETIAQFLAHNHPQIEVCSVNVADGGEGMVEALRSPDYEQIRLTVSDPLGRPIEATYLIDPKRNTAIIEMASAAGLSLVEESLRNPLITSTFGVGQMIAHALDRSIDHFVIGIGGSATTDAGLGMLSALGFRFFDQKGELIGHTGGDLRLLYSIDDQCVDSHLRKISFDVACDVRNPLYGANGAAYIFAPQKGADDKMVRELDCGLRNFALAVERFNAVQINDIEGAGAAGGLGGAFVGLLGAKLRRGIDMVLDYQGFDRLVEGGAALVITGEGHLDRQTLMGKAPQGVLRIARQAGVKKVVAIAGRIDNRDELSRAGFADLIEISPRNLELSQALRAEVARANIICALEKLPSNYFTLD